MRNRAIVLFFILITSCQNFSTYENNNTYEKIGFADFTKNDDVIHRNISPNSKVKITNLLNKKSIVVEVNKNSNYKKEREIIIPNKYIDLLELNYILPIVKIETLRTNKTFKADTVKIFDEEKKITQNVEIKNVDIIDLSKNNSSKYSDRRLSNDNVDKAEIISTFPLLTPKFVSMPHKAIRISLSTLNLALTFSSKGEFSFKRCFAACILFSSTLFSKYS